jgi:hypothetical protein
MHIEFWDRTGDEITFAEAKQIRIREICHLPGPTSARDGVAKGIAGPVCSL